MVHGYLSTQTNCIDVDWLAFLIVRDLQGQFLSFLFAHVEVVGLANDFLGAVVEDIVVGFVDEHVLWIDHYLHCD